MKKKLIFIPADGIKSEISRSFFIARYLSDEYDLYYFDRADPQDGRFSNVSTGKWYTLLCFFRSIFRRVTIKRHPVYAYHIVALPFITHMIVYRLIGIDRALKIARRINGFMLRKICKRLKADIVFYADGCDSYPVISGVVCYIDVQDDYDENDYRNTIYNKSYALRNFKLARLRFIVSKSAGIRLGQMLGLKFNYVPNGVEFDSLLNVDRDRVQNLKRSLNIEGKTVVSYIGAEAWVDSKFAIELFTASLKSHPDIHFVIVGNLPALKNVILDNVTIVGAVSKESSYLYYHISDFGILLKNSKDSNFLSNSIPLKIIQYGGLGKKIISPGIRWLEEELFSNVFILEEFSVKNILSTIISNPGQMDTDKRWAAYDWNSISKDIYNLIEQSS